VRLGLLSFVFIVSYALGGCKEVVEQEILYFVGSGIRKISNVKTVLAPD